MKLLMVMVGLVALFSIPAAFAATQVQSRDYTCAGLRELVQQEGELIVIGYWGHVHDVFSQEKLRCGAGERAMGVLVPAQDRRICSIGLVCAEWDGFEREPREPMPRR